MPAPAHHAAAAAATSVRMIVSGLAVLTIGMVVVRNGDVPDAEQTLFRSVNDLSDALYTLMFPFQLFGTLVIGPIVAVVAVILRRYRLAIAALVVTVLKLLTERSVKALVSRQRPGTSVGLDIQARGDVSLAGESFVSGHAVLVAGLAGVITPYLPGRWKVVPWLFVVAVMVGRVYVGAHNPLDVVCGAALGIAIAGGVNLLIPVRRNVQAVTDVAAVPV